MKIARTAVSLCLTRLQLRYGTLLVVLYSSSTILRAITMFSAILEIPDCASIFSRRSSSHDSESAVVVVAREEGRGLESDAVAEIVSQSFPVLNSQRFRVD